MKKSDVTDAQPYNEIYRFTKKFYISSNRSRVQHNPPYSLNPTMTGDAAFHVCHFGTSAV